MAATAVAEAAAPGRAEGPKHGVPGGRSLADGQTAMRASWHEAPGGRSLLEMPMTEADAAGRAEGLAASHAARTSGPRNKIVPQPGMTAAATIPEHSGRPEKGVLQVELG